jgi:hypothetical protein
MVAGLRSYVVAFQSEIVKEKRDEEAEQVNPVLAAQECPQEAQKDDVQLVVFGGHRFCSDTW